MASKIEPRFGKSRRSNKSSSLKNFLVLVIGGGGLLAVLGYFYLKSWGVTPVVLSEPVVINFPRGTSGHGLAQTLQKNALVTDARRFQFWTRLFAESNKFQAGMYRFEGSVTPAQIAEAITAGKIYEPIVVQFTIPEGFTVKQFVERLVANKVGTKAEVEALTKDKAFMASLKIPANTFEGYLYPATYSFTKMIDAKTAFKTVVDTFWERLPPNYQNDIKTVGLTLNQGVTFASLIELETQLEEEKPLVAEVIWRRLKARQPLAIDAALIYGIKDYKGDITWKNLRDRSNPFNTRIHPGLPPSAIGSPSASSLTAVLNPTDHGYWFYVLDLKNGNHHHFSKSLAEHNAYVKELVQATKNPEKTATADQQNK